MDGLLVSIAVLVSVSTCLCALLTLRSFIHGYIALTTVPTVVSEFSRLSERVYCCAECKRESKRRHGKSDSDEHDNDRTVLLRDVEAGEA